MTAIATRLTGSQFSARDWLLGAGVVTALLVSAGISGGQRGVLLLLLAVGVSAGLQLDVQLPWGGSIPLGHALVIALAEILPLMDMAVVMPAALLLTFAMRRRQRGGAHAAAVVALFAASAGAAMAVRAAAVELHHGLNLGTDINTSRTVLGRVALAGAAYLIVDLLGRGRLLAARNEKLRGPEVVPVYVTLVCAAALLAIAYRGSGPATAMVAAVPLLITRFSFERYSSARATYRQTIQALSMVPEVAGLTPLGHGERTATYAAAVADELRLAPDVAYRITTAARLHHIGHISLHEPQERTVPIDAEDLARVGAEILRETGILADVADLVSEVQHSRRGGPELSQDAAIVRVASTLDDLVGDDRDRVAGALVDLLARHNEGIERSMAITLLQLCDEQPSLIDDAIRSGEPLTLAAVDHGGHDHEEHGHCV